MAIDLVAVLRLDDQMTQSLKSAAVGATAGFAVISAAAAASVKTFADFDTAIRKTGAIAGANAEELSLLSDVALDLGASTSKSATEVANSMTEMAAAGFEVNEVIGAMPGIIAASEASGESLAVAADVVSSSLNIWALEAENATHVADVLAMAANVSAAGITDLGYAFKYAGAPAAALGISLEETAAAIGLITNTGIDGSSAGTSLRAALLALNNPAKAQEKIMKQLGFSVTDANNEFKSLSTMIGDMRTATEGMTEADKVATLAKLVGTEAVSGFLALMAAGPAEIDKMTAALVNSGGAAEETAKQMMGGIGGAWEEMSGAIETLAIRVGERLAPAVVSFAKIVANMNFDPFINAVGFIGDIAGNVAKLIEDNWSKIAPILTPIAVVIAGMATSFLLIGGAAAVFMALSAAIGFISAPIAGVALGIGAVVGGLAILYSKIEPFKQLVNDTFGGLKIALGFETEQPQAPKAAEGTGAVMMDEGFTAPSSDGVSSFAEKFSQIFTRIRESAGTAVDFVKTKFAELQPALTPLIAIFSQVWGTVSNIFSSAWSIISPILNGLWSILQVVGQYAAIMFFNVLVPALGFAAQAFSTLWSIAQPILTLLALGFEVLMAAVKTLWDNVLAPFIMFITTGVKNAFDTFSEVLGVISGGFDALSGKIGGVYDKVREFADTIRNVKLPDWITSGVSATVNFVGNMIGSKPKGSHYNGLDSVPYDGYVATLHRGERVQTAQEVRAEKERGGGLTIAKLADQIIVREDADIDKITMALAQLLEREALQRG